LFVNHGEGIGVALLIDADILFCRRPRATERHDKRIESASGSADERVGSGVAPVGENQGLEATMTKQPSLAFKGTLARAYRRASRAGIAQVGTDLVLCYAAVHVRCVWDRVPSPWHKAWRPVRKGRTGLTDPQPPARTVWRDAFDEEVAFEADAVLRDASFDGSETVRARYRRRSELPPMPAFSPAVRHAVYEAIHEAARKGVEHAGPQHLLVGLLALPDSAAYRMLHEWWVPGHASLKQIVRADLSYHENGNSSEWAVGGLTFMRVLPATGPRLWRWPWRTAVWLLEKQVRRPYRRHGARYGHPILLLIENDATYKAVHIGHAVVTATHVLLSVIDLHEQLASAGKTLPDEVARWNQAGVILSAHGVQGRTATRVAARLASGPSDVEGDLAGLPTRGWPPPRVRLGSPAQGRTALAALREASLCAHRLGHPYAGTTHLLGVLLAEPDGPVARLLRQLGANPDAVQSDVARRLQSAGRP
jgi:Clp amino terminal domain, pathogenicity island component